MLKKIDRAACRQLREHINKALEPVAKALGVQIRAGNASFSGGNVKFQLSVSLIDDSGNALTKEAEDFKAQAVLYGLDPSQLFQEFVDRGKRYKIVGLRTKSPKYPILAEEVETGKTYKFPDTLVRRCLEAKSDG